MLSLSQVYGHCLCLHFRSACRLREMWSRAVWWATSSTSTSKREQEDCGRYKNPEKRRYLEKSIRYLSLHGFQVAQPLCTFLSWSSLSAPGRLINGSASSHRGRGRATGLWHHQEASDPIGLHGGYRVHTFPVSLPVLLLSHVMVVPGGDIS